MMDTTKTAQSFLNQLVSESGKMTYETLSILLDQLENKNDPGPEEMRLVEQIYNFMEHLKRIENNIRSYVKNSSEEPLGSKLSNLYDELDNRNVW
jgi:hypothetical protein